MPALSERLPHSVKALLGADTRGSPSQCLAAMVLLEVLAWSRTGDGEGDEREGDPAEADGPGESSRALGAEAQPTEGAAGALAGAPASPGRAGPPAPEQEAPATPGAVRLEQGREQKSSAWRLRLLARSRSSMSGASDGSPLEIVPLFASCSRAMAGCSLLPFVSLLTWASTWSSPGALPFLLGAVLLMHVRAETLPMGFFRPMLLYEVICSVGLYSYNVYWPAFVGEVSAVPKTYTWADWARLQTLMWGRGTTDSAHMVFVLRYTLAVLIFAVATRSVKAKLPQPAGRLASSSQLGTRSSLLETAVAFARPLTVLAALGVALVDGSPSLIGLGYVLWVVALVAVGSSVAFERSGWDVLYGLPAMWRLLLLYSNGVGAALLVWQVIAPADSSLSSLVGLRRSPGSVAQVAWPHLCVALLAWLQVAARRAGVLQPVLFLTSTSAMAWVLWLSGIYVQMMLMFAVVMMPPVKVDSFVYLVLFVCIVALEQINPMSTWRNPFLGAIVGISGVWMPVRYALLMPASQGWLERALPPSMHPETWRAFAFQDGQGMRLSLFLIGLLLVLSSGLRRLYLCGASTSLRGRRPRLRPALRRLIREVARWSMSLLLFAAYFLMLREDALSRVQIVVLVAFLVRGRNWEFAGALISVSSMALLLSQYLFRLLDMGPAEKAFLGLEWDGDGAVRLEVALLLLGIAQRTAQRASHHLRESLGADSDESLGKLYDRRLLRSELAAYGVQLGAVLLLLCAIFANAAWSVVHVLIVVALRFSGSSVRKLEPWRTDRWLRLMAWALGLSLIFRNLCDLWLRYDRIWRLDEERLSNSWVCGVFDGQIRVCADGSADPGCPTQRERCGKAWATWVELNADGTFDIWNFLALYGVCLLRHLCLREIELQGCDTAASEARGDMELGTVSLGAASGEEASQPERSSSVLEERRRPDDEPAPGAGAGCPTADGACSACGELPATAGREEVRPRDRLLPQLVYQSTSLALWLSLAGAAMVTSRTSLFTMGYMVMLFAHVLTAESTQTLKEPFNARLRVLRCIRNFNLLVCVLQVAFQCPTLPCPLMLEMSTADGSALTHFTSPAQCIQLQDQADRRAPGSGLDLLLLLGLRKEDAGLTFDWSRFWNVAVFLAGAAQAAACERWRGELIAALARQTRRFEEREGWYVEHLMTWRRLELSRIDTKHEVLLLKLQALTRYLNEVRAVWSSKREPISDEEKLQHKHEARIFDLCLKSGACQEEVEEALATVNAVALPLLLVDDAIGFNAVRAVNLAVDDGVVSLLEIQELVHLRSISREQEVLKHRALMRRCQKATAEVVAEALEWTPEAVIAAAEEKASDLGSSPRPPGLGEGLRRVATLLMPDAAARRGWLEANARKCGNAIVRAVRWVCQALMNDLLYTRDGDRTLHCHQLQDPLWKLVGKAALSQTLPLLISLMVLQFVIYMSIASAINVSAIVLSLMAFPHPPRYFWKALQVYNLFLIALKMIYQTPLFPSDSTAGHIPAEAILGLLKVMPKGQLAYRSLAGALWGDLLLCVLLFGHWRALRQSGRLGDPELIRARLDEDDHGVASRGGGGNARVRALRGEQARDLPLKKFIFQKSNPNQSTNSGFSST